MSSSPQPVHPPKAARQAPAVPSPLQHPAGRTDQLGHGRNRKQNLHSRCLGRVGHLPPSHNPPPHPSSPQAGTSRAAPMPWHRGPDGASPSQGLSGPTQLNDQPPCSGKRGQRLAPSQAPLAMRPLPHAEGDPPVSLALTCCPRRVPWPGRQRFARLAPGAKSPPWSGVGLTQSSFSRTPDGKAIQPCSFQPCSPPLPFRKQLVAIQSRERVPREPNAHLGNAPLG